MNLRDIKQVVRGWAIVHPSGWVELAYFDNQHWDDKGRNTTRTIWMRKYRPQCRMIRLALEIPAAAKGRTGT